MDDHKDGWEWYRVRKYYSVCYVFYESQASLCHYNSMDYRCCRFSFLWYYRKAIPIFLRNVFLQIILSSFLTKSNKYEWPRLFCLLLSIIDKDNPLRCTKVSSMYMWTVSIYRKYKILSLCHCHFHQVFAILGFASTNGRWWMRVLFILVTLSH